MNVWANDTFLAEEKMVQAVRALYTNNTEEFLLLWLPSPAPSLGNIPLSPRDLCGKHRTRVWRSWRKSRSQEHNQYIFSSVVSRIGHCGLSGKLIQYKQHCVQARPYFPIETNHKWTCQLICRLGTADPLAKCCPVPVSQPVTLDAIMLSRLV